MKKNIVLAMGAFVFAVGSAVASKALIEENIFVHGQFGNEQSDIECIDTKVKCEQSATGICTVSVPLSGGGSATASTNGTNKTYQAGCTTTLGSSTSASVVSTLSGSQRPTRLKP